mgnify:FL=1
MLFQNIRTTAVLLIALVILFSAAALPAKEDSPGGNRAITELEMQTITDAMAVVYLDIGYYVSIENLNDLLSDNTTYDFDNIDQYGGTRVIDLDAGLFHETNVDLTVPPRQWRGPYVSYQDDRISEDGEGYDEGTLLDLWGTPYYLFSPAGLVRTDERIVTQELYGDYFNVYAVVSLGPDAVVSEDDIYRTFGTPPTDTVITSLSTTEAAPGDRISIRGYNLGTRTRQIPELYLNGDPVTTIVSWTNTEIVFEIPADAQSGTLWIEIDTEKSNSLSLTITQTPTSASHWVLYQ